MDSNRKRLPLITPLLPPQTQEWHVQDSRAPLLCREDQKVTNMGSSVGKPVNGMSRWVTEDGEATTMPTSKTCFSPSKAEGGALGAGHNTTVSGPTNGRGVVGEKGMTRRFSGSMLKGRGSGWGKLAQWGSSRKHLCKAKPAAAACREPETDMNRGGTGIGVGSVEPMQVVSEEGVTKGGTVHSSEYKSADAALERHSSSMKAHLPPSPASDPISTTKSNLGNATEFVGGKDKARIGCRQGSCGDGGLRSFPRPPIRSIPVTGKGLDHGPGVTGIAVGGDTDLKRMHSTPVVGLESEVRWESLQSHLQPLHLVQEEEKKEGGQGEQYLPRAVAVRQKVLPEQQKNLLLLKLRGDSEQSQHLQSEVEHRLPPDPHPPKHCKEQQGQQGSSPPLQTPEERAASVADARATLRRSVEARLQSKAAQDAMGEAVVAAEVAEAAAADAIAAAGSAKDEEDGLNEATHVTDGAGLVEPSGKVRFGACSGVQEGAGVWEECEGRPLSACGLQLPNVKTSQVTIVDTPWGPVTTPLGGRKRPGGLPRGAWGRNSLRAWKAGGKEEGARVGTGREAPGRLRSCSLPAGDDNDRPAALSTPPVSSLSPYDHKKVPGLPLARSSTDLSAATSDEAQTPPDAASHHPPHLPSSLMTMSTTCSSYSPLRSSARMPFVSIWEDVENGTGASAPLPLVSPGWGRGSGSSEIFGGSTAMIAARHNVPLNDSREGGSGAHRPLEVAAISGSSELVPIAEKGSSNLIGGSGGGGGEGVREDEGMVVNLEGMKANMAVEVAGGGQDRRELDGNRSFTPPVYMDGLESLRWDSCRKKLTGASAVNAVGLSIGVKDGDDCEDPAPSYDHVMMNNVETSGEPPKLTGSESSRWSVSPSIWSSEGTFPQSGGLEHQRRDVDSVNAIAVGGSLGGAGLEREGDDNEEGDVEDEDSGFGDNDVLGDSFDGIMLSSAGRGGFLGDRLKDGVAFPKLVKSVVNGKAVSSPTTSLAVATALSVALASTSVVEGDEEEDLDYRDISFESRVERGTCVSESTDDSFTSMDADLEKLNSDFVNQVLSKEGQRERKRSPMGKEVDGEWREDIPAMDDSSTSHTTLTDDEREVLVPISMAVVKDPVAIDRGAGAAGCGPKGAGGESAENLGGGNVGGMVGVFVEEGANVEVTSPEGLGNGNGQVDLVSSSEDVVVVAGGSSTTMPSAPSSVEASVVVAGDGDKNGSEAGAGRMRSATTGNMYGRRHEGEGEWEGEWEGIASLPPVPPGGMRRAESLDARELLELAAMRRGTGGGGGGSGGNHKRLTPRSSSLRASPRALGSGMRVRRKTGLAALEAEGKVHRAAMIAAAEGLREKRSKDKKRQRASSIFETLRQRNAENFQFQHSSQVGCKQQGQWTVVVGMGRSVKLSTEEETVGLNSPPGGGTFNILDGSDNFGGARGDMFIVGGKGDGSGDGGHVDSTHISSNVGGHDENPGFQVEGGGSDSCVGVSAVSGHGGGGEDHSLAVGDGGESEEDDSDEEEDFWARYGVIDHAALEDGAEMEL